MFGLVDQSIQSSEKVVWREVSDISAVVLLQLSPWAQTTDLFSGGHAGVQVGQDRNGQGLLQEDGLVCVESVCSFYLLHRHSIFERQALQGLPGLQGVLYPPVVHRGQLRGVDQAAIGPGATTSRQGYPLS